MQSQLVLIGQCEKNTLPTSRHSTNTQHGAFDKTGGNSNIFWNFHPDPWGDDPIWRSYFSDGLVKNHQLENQDATNTLFGIGLV